MKICLICNNGFEQNSWLCPSCGTTPALIGNYLSFAPMLSEQNDNFRSEDFEKLATIEATNFWFRSRNRLIVWALQKYFLNIKNFLEIGCGTGYVLSGIEQALPNIHLSGSEIHSSGLVYAAQRLKQTELFQMDARYIPFKEEFDVIGAFDVLEHIQEDEAVLLQMCQAVRQGGGIVLTVPQHPFLWSYADEYACHVRRYSAQELKTKLDKCGFRLIKMTSFVTLLLPLMLISRLKRKKQENFDPMSEVNMSNKLNVLLEKIMGVERRLIQFGMSLPVGGSLLVIAKKK